MLVTKKMIILLLSLQLISCSKQIYIETFKNPYKGYYEYYEINKTNGFIEVKNSKTKPRGTSKFICTSCGPDSIVLGYKWVFRNKIIRKRIYIKALAIQ